MHLLLRFFYRTERAAYNGAFQVFSYGVCSQPSPHDLPTHSPLLPHDDSIFTLFGRFPIRKVIVLIADYRMPNRVAPKSCGCMDLALGPQCSPVLVMPRCFFIMFQVFKAQSC